MTERCAIFIDGAYLDKCLEHAFGRVRIKFEELAAQLIGDDSLLRAYYYHCPPYVSQDATDSETYRFENKQRFFNALGNIPRFQVRLGLLVYRGTTESGKPIFIQKLVDVMVAVDMVQLASTGKLNRAILLAGDNDFVPAVKAVKDYGVIVTLVHGPQSTGNVHSRLWDIADERTVLTSELINEISLNG